LECYEHALHQYQNKSLVSKEYIRLSVLSLLLLLVKIQNTQTMSGLPVLLFLDISGGELLVIMLVVFLVFGPEKMPEMARKAGRFMNQLKKASNDLTREFKKETSVLEQEINAVQKKVSDQVESVSREVNRTKAQITNDLSIETQVEKPVASAVLSTEEPVDSKTADAEGKTDIINPGKTE